MLIQKYWVLVRNHNFYILHPFLNYVTEDIGKRTWSASAICRRGYIALGKTHRFKASSIQLRMVGWHPNLSFESSDQTGRVTPTQIYFTVRRNLRMIHLPSWWLLFWPFSFDRETAGFRRLWYGAAWISWLLSYAVFLILRPLNSGSRYAHLALSENQMLEVWIPSYQLHSYCSGRHKCMCDSLMPLNFQFTFQLRLSIGFHAGKVPCCGMHIAHGMTGSDIWQIDIRMFVVANTALIVDSHLCTYNATNIGNLML